MSENTERLNGNESLGQGIQNQKAKSSGTGRKVGIFVVIFGLLAVIAFASDFIFSAFGRSNDEKVKQKETKAEVKTYRPPEKTFEQVPPKQFSFDEPEPADMPVALIGDEPRAVQAEATPTARLVKSSGGNMMNKLAGEGVTSRDNSEQQYNDMLESDNQAVNQAIAEAQKHLQAQGTNNDNSVKGSLGSGSSGDIFNGAPTFKASAARKSPYNPNLLLEQGTLIPCALRVRVISNISGQISCTISENVYSANGNVLLINKGSRVNGYYEGNSVQHGSSQLFVIWQEIRTLDNLIIPLNSGSTDELGANGLSGWVDQHFWERFSNAIMLSMILDGNNILLSKMAGSTASNTENTREAAKDIATTVLEQMGDIKPTLYKNQGDKVGIFVARDIDFSDVYDLKLNK